MLTNVVIVNQHVQASQENVLTSKDGAVDAFQHTGHYALGSMRVYRIVVSILIENLVEIGGFNDLAIGQNLRY
jgi:hypothetical protein